jgi:phosphoglycerate dehydrogenase-like enzyme
MTATLNVHLAQGFDQLFVDQLGAGLSESVNLTDGPMPPEGADYSILVAGRPTRMLLEASPNLTTLLIPWAGLPTKTREVMLEYPRIAVHNIHHNATPTAEMALALLMNAAKNLVTLDRSMRRQDWTLRYATSATNTLLEGKTVVILGYGAIGKRVAAKCRGLGMDVIVVRKSISEPEEGDFPFYPVGSLIEVLHRADALIVAVPLTPESRDLVGIGELAALRDHAIVVNISRGPVVGERALYEELRTGRIRAGLDVWYYYPADADSRTATPPSNYPYEKLDNVVMSPHVGGNSDQTEQLRIAELQSMINLAAAGQPMPNRLDVERGY